ncbi:FIST signal transduction protein [Lusitaniella coriacea]|nr:FIST N-terminal domain-containing protein [Lusitaniella coriacea]
MKIAVGHSLDPDSLEAIDEVLEQCDRILEGAKPKAGILFAAIGFDYALILKRIDEVFPNIELIGGTTDGEVSSIFGFQQDSITLMVFDLENVEIRAAVGRNISEDPTRIARETVEKALESINTSPKFCIALPESLTTSTVSILSGLQLALENVPIFGGATADNWEFQCTHQFYKTEVLSDSVPILLFAGDLLFSHGVSSGWKPLGKKGVLTKVDRNIVYEIDNNSALDFYRYYLDGLTAVAEYPIAVFSPDTTQFYLRGCMGYDESAESITLAGDVFEGAVIQIAEAACEDILAASKIAFKNAMETYPGENPIAVLIFSCASRRHLLGMMTNEEYEIIQGCFDRDILSCGFYTYGEISPLLNKNKAVFHNITFTSLLIGK